MASDCKGPQSHQPYGLRAEGVEIHFTIGDCRIMTLALHLQCWCGTQILTYRLYAPVLRSSRLAPEAL